nr:B12-binding domain-containing radical SAM protein [Sedimentibacter sp.]
MIVFLEKIRVKTVFSAFEPIKVEPLELCYLKTVLNNMDVENYLIDGLFKLKEPEGVSPDVVVLTGYNVAEEEIIKSARKYKSKYPNIIVIVGGVHIQGNSNEFHVEGIDYVFHSQSLYTFQKLIEKIINRDKKVLTTGVDSFISAQHSDESIWHMGESDTLYNIEDVVADRSIFYQISDKVRYLEKKNVALIKSGIGCPYNCSYCYCKELNSSHYVKADYEKMVSEMRNIEADYFWIVDDVLFSTRKNALDFIDAIKKKNMNVKIIAYLRADFILREKDILKQLRGIGIVEVIVGFEATNNDELLTYEKTTDALDYPEVIALLRKNKIDLTALFMVKPEYGFDDFKNLKNFIKLNNIDVFTISIFTPIKGTREYVEADLITQNPKKFDFLHLVLKSKLPKCVFYFLFYRIHLRLLKSKRIWQYIAGRR